MGVICSLLLFRTGEVRILFFGSRFTLPRGEAVAHLPFSRGCYRLKLALRFGFYFSMLSSSIKCVAPANLSIINRM